MKALLWLVFCGVVAIVNGAWECNNTVSPPNYVAFPNLYDSVLVLLPDGVNCNLFQDSLFQCLYSRVLGDGRIPSTSPNLDSKTYLRNFLAWEREAEVPYLDFDFTGLAVPLTAIRITFLNSPLNNISLPDVDLYSVVYGTSLTSNSFTAIPSLLLDNQDLTINDNQIRIITIVPSISVSSLHLRLGFTFTESYHFNWFLLSEVTFCADTLQPLIEPNVTFVIPQTLSIQPSEAELMSGTIRLMCTVSSQGHYSWQWLKNNKLLTNDQSHSTSVGAGTRTAILTLLNLTFASAGSYSCVARTADAASEQVVDTLTQEISFPEIVESPPLVSGEEEVTLVCEVYGYLTVPSLPLWVDPWGTPLTESTRLNISASSGNKSIVLENGTTLPSIIVTLVISNLSLTDEGNYTCKRARGESVSVTLVTVVIPPPPTTHPPTTLPPSTPPPTTQHHTGISQDVSETSSTLDSEVTTPAHNITPSQPAFPVPVIAVTGVIGGLTLLCLIIIVPPLVVYAVQRLMYKQEKRELEQTATYELESTPDTETDSFQPMMEYPGFKTEVPHQTAGRGQFEQSEIFNYIKDL